MFVSMYKQLVLLCNCYEQLICFVNGSYLFKFRGSLGFAHKINFTGRLLYVVAQNIGCRTLRPMLEKSPGKNSSKYSKTTNVFFYLLAWNRGSSRFNSNQQIPTITVLN